MHALRIAVGAAWILFWAYWLAAAVGANASRRSRRRLPATGLTIVAVVVLVRVFGRGGAQVHAPALGAIGAVLFAAGLALAIWARLHLGRNWGMPMSEKADPELVTSGPYRLIRHPIYSGLLLGILGTALVDSLLGLILVAVLTAYFTYVTTVEERNLTAAFPTAYPEYRARTKRLIPFVL